LVSPAFNHWFPPFRAWLDAEKAADFPNETENRTARLGVVGAVAWLALMVTLVVPARESDRDHDPVPAAARLSVAAVLLATLGGLGSLFSLISPAIRAYNRISPFIAFFALAAVAIWIDRLTAARPRGLRVALCAALLVVGLADQWSAARGFGTGSHVAANWNRLAAFVADLEARLPDAAMVFQLPIRPYPGDPSVEKMGVYDHFRPYLMSRRLRWSYPALTARQKQWEQSVTGRPAMDWPATLVQDGFSAILLDRAGYADRGESVIALLRAGGAAPLAEDERYIALELRRR
jgi:phosphoglycerol transferase